MSGDGVVFVDTGPTANLVRPRWLGTRNLRVGKQGLPRESAYPACARPESAMDAFATCALLRILQLGSQGEKEIVPPFLRKGTFEALGGQLDSSSDALPLRKRGVGTSPTVNQGGIVSSE